MNGRRDYRCVDGTAGKKYGALPGSPTNGTVFTRPLSVNEANFH